MELFRLRQRELIFLPPYSPQLNQIEEVFSTIKARYRALTPQPSNRDQAKTAVSNQLDGLKVHDFTGFFRHMRAFVALSLAGQPFI